MSIVVAPEPETAVRLFVCPDDPSLGLIPEDELSGCEQCGDDPRPECPDCEGSGLVVGYRGPGYGRGEVLRACPVAVRGRAD